MRFLAVWLILLLLVGSPIPSSPLTELTPVEILCLSRDGDDVLARCDGGITARGTTAQKAVENLHLAAPGRLELGTVDYAVLTDLPVSALQKLGLRPACSVYASAFVEDPDALAVYLRSHSAGVTLGMLQETSGLSVPTLLPGETGPILP